MKLKYVEYHLPEKCKCFSHENKIFLKREKECTVANANEALKKISIWNRTSDCWLYTPISIEV